jgi:hypothetical protein
VDETPVGLRDLHRRDVVVSVSARAAGRQRKEGRVTMVQPAGETYTIASDEGSYLGGEASAPSPLMFFSASLAF